MIIKRQFWCQAKILLVQQLVPRTYHMTSTRLLRHAWPGSPASGFRGRSEALRSETPRERRGQQLPRPAAAPRAGRFPPGLRRGSRLVELGQSQVWSAGTGSTSSSGHLLQGSRKLMDKDGCNHAVPDVFRSHEMRQYSVQK